MRRKAGARIANYNGWSVNGDGKFVGATAYRQFSFVFALFVRICKALTAGKVGFPNDAGLGTSDISGGYVVKAFELSVFFTLLSQLQNPLGALQVDISQLL